MWIVIVMSILIANLVSDALAKDKGTLQVTSRNYSLNQIKIYLPFPYKNLKVAVDDYDNLYIQYNGTVFVYDKKGISKQIELLIDDKKSLGSLLEVSSAGDLFFIASKVKPYNRIFVYNKNGNLVNTIHYNNIFRINQKNIYRAENYSKGKKIGMYALNSNLDKIIDYSSYYLPKDKLNQKPKGFIDNDMNLFYMWYWPDFYKIGPSGYFISKQKIAYDAEFWRLIGIDSKNILYALVTRNNKSEIVKFDDKAKLVSSIAIEDKNNISKVIDNAEEGDAEASNYIVIGNGNIYIKNAVHPQNLWVTSGSGSFPSV